MSSRLEVQLKKEQELKTLFIGQIFQAAMSAHGDTFQDEVRETSLIF